MLATQHYTRAPTDHYLQTGAPPKILKMFRILIYK